MSTLNPDLSSPTCRVCLQNNLEEEMSSIFDLDTDLQDLHIYEKIEQCADIKVLMHDRMPSLICADCYGILKVSYKFRTICRNSNEYLNEVLAIENVIPKVEKGESNHLSVSSANVKQVETKHNKYKTRSKEKTNLSQKIITEENTIPRYTDLSSEDYIEDDFVDKQVDEEWFNIDYDKDEDYLSSNENIKLSTEKLDVNINEQMDNSQNNKKSIKRKKKNSIRHKKSNNSPSKTLDISSDGAAIIREKKTRIKREKKEKQPHICEVCGNKYQRRYGLELHMRRHRDEKPYECEICAHAFHSNFELIRHMRKHTGLKPYKCSYCPRAFGDQSTLIKHERLHRNERPFKCDTCGKSFTYSNVLKHHKLTHTGEKPYTCELCGKCFTRPHHLRAHLETLQHQNDPRSKVLLQNIKRTNKTDSLKVERIILQV